MYIRSKCVSDLGTTDLKFGMQHNLTLEGNMGCVPPCHTSGHITLKIPKRYLRKTLELRRDLNLAHTHRMTLGVAWIGFHQATPLLFSVSDNQ